VPSLAQPSRAVRSAVRSTGPWQRAWQSLFAVLAGRRGSGLVVNARISGPLVPGGAVAEGFLMSLMAVACLPCDPGHRRRLGDLQRAGHRRNGCQAQRAARARGNVSHEFLINRSGAASSMSQTRRPTRPGNSSASDRRRHRDQDQRAARRRGNVGNPQINPGGTRVVYAADQQVDNKYEISASRSPAAPLSNSTPRSPRKERGVVQDQPDGARVIYLTTQASSHTQELFSVPIAGGPPSSSTPRSSRGGAWSGPLDQPRRLARRLSRRPADRRAGRALQRPDCGGAALKLNPVITNSAGMSCGSRSAPSAAASSSSPTP